MSNENKLGNEAISATIGGDRIENKKVNLLDKFFEIPPYQRLYEWGENEINELLDDMKKAFSESKKEYFIGTITTSKKDDKFVLIDGQQRLTTLWFIGFYLVSQNCGEWQKKWQDFIAPNGNLRIAMPIRDNEEKALKELSYNINGKQNLAQFLKGCNVAQKIIDAFGCIESWFNSGNGKGIDLAKFAQFIYEKVCFVLVELAENTDLNRFFVRMNNRGKQLEKHEILKARMLNAIRKSDKDNEGKKDEWQKYAKIWDLCSDMNKYIFQSASDRKDLNSKDESGDKQNIDAIIKSQSNFNNKKTANNDDTPSKVESIIDFPTFLLHCYKLWVAKKCADKVEKIIIAKDKLLEIMWDNKDSKGNLIIDNNDGFIFNCNNQSEQNKVGQNCKEFIIDMLRYRVLFDYFVVKDNKKLGERDKNSYTIKHLNKDNNEYHTVSESNVFENLAMIQNYLRVARPGERQNYEHWLTDFLKFLNTNKDLQNISDIKEMKNFVDNFLNNANNKELQLPQSLIVGKDKKNKIDKALQNKLVAELEKIDTARIYSVNLKEQHKNADFKINESFLERYLSNGTGTPHYWFYRSEYYLWKWGKQRDKISDEIKAIFAKFDGLEFPNGDKFKFEKILNEFYFRNLNSVEHIEPQSNFRKEFGWTEQNIERFGNLALISPFFNSQLSNQSSRHKALDLRKKIDDGNAESLKLWLVYAMYIKESDKWTYKDAKEHQNQMLEILAQSLKNNITNSR